LTAPELDELLDTADRMRSVDSRAAVNLTLEAITAARRKKNLKAQTRAYHILSTLFISMDDQRRAATYAGLSIRFAKDYGCVEYLAKSLLVRASASMRQFEIDKASRDLCTVMEVLSVREDFDAEGYFFRVLTVLFRGLGNFETSLKAANFCVQSYQKIESSPQKKMMGHLTRFNLLTEYAVNLESSRSAKLDQILDLAEESFEHIDLDISNQLLLQESHACMGDFFLASRQYPEAKSSFQKAIQIAEENNMKFAKNFSESRLVLALARSGDHESANRKLDSILEHKTAQFANFDDQEITKTLFRSAMLLQNSGEAQLRDQLTILRKKRERGLESARGRLQILESFFQKQPGSNPRFFA
jgi:tetratricopeptide (TPR) repeat protein